MIKRVSNFPISWEVAMKHLKFHLLCFFVCAMQLLPTAALSMIAATSTDQIRLLSRNQLHLVQSRECSQRVGPFATQSTAWERLRQAESQGYGVSGVFPCYGDYGRGYCFNIFFPC